MMADDDGPTRRLAAALASLDPTSRALLELAARHYLDEDQIARLAGSEPRTVAGQRDQAIRDVAEQVGTEAPAAWRSLSNLPGEHWPVVSHGLGALPQHTVRRTAAPSDISPDPRSIRAMAMLAILTVVAEVVIAVVAAVIGGGRS